MQQNLCKWLYTSPSPFLDSCCKSEILGERAYCFEKVGRKLKAHMNESELYLQVTVSFKTKSQLGTLTAKSHP